MSNIHDGREYDPEIDGPFKDDDKDEFELKLESLNKRIERLETIIFFDEDDE